MRLSIHHFPSFIIISLSLGKDQKEPWQQCEVILAPSSIKGGGWGVYAARDFEEGEIVEISPRFVPMPHESPVIQNSVIDDYIYGYLRWQDETQSKTNLAAVVFGNVMFYNHNREPNIKWVSLGREPVPGKEEGLTQTNGIVARRKIEAGEELFSTYGDTDGGKQWFKERRLELIDIPTYASRKNGTVYENDKETYCPKVYSGIGRPTWSNRVLASVSEGAKFPYYINHERLAPRDHPNAVVTQDVPMGTVVEMAPALAVNMAKMTNTPLAPMSFFWKDLDKTQRQDLIDLRASNDLKVQHQDMDTKWVRQDHFHDFDDIVLFPAAGNIALIERVGSSEEANCMLEITSSGSMKSHLDHGGGGGSAGVLLKVVTTKNLKTGERLKLDVPVSASPYENRLLAEELQRTGQPVPDFLWGFLLDKVTDEL